MSETLSVLLVEDNELDATYIAELFRELDWPKTAIRDQHKKHQLVHVETLAACQAQLGTGEPDIVLLDLNLPDSRGIETVETVLSETSGQPVVVLTGLKDEQIGIRAIEAGAQDYLRKDELTATLLGRTVRYALERKRRETKLERNRNFMRQTELLADTGGWEYNPTEKTVRWTDGTYKIHGVDPTYEVTFDSLAEFYENVEQIEADLSRCVSDREPFETEHKIVTADGEQRWVRVNGEPVESGGDIERVRGAIQDITAQKRKETKLAANEQTLRDLHTTTRELLQAQTGDEVVEYVATRAADVLDFPHVDVLQFDSDGGVLRSVSAASEDGIEIEPGPNRLWQLYRDGNAAVFTREVPANLPVPKEGIESVLVAPIGEFGLLVAVTTATHETEPSGIDLVELLAANAQAALERLERQRELEQISDQLAAQETRIHELEALTESVHRIQQRIADSETRDELEEAVCAELVGTDRLDFAWLSRPQVADDDLVATAWAGSEYSYLDEVLLGDDKDSSTGYGRLPAKRAAGQRQTVEISNIANRVRTERWAKDALSHQFQSVISMPLLYEGVLYGVLSVYSRHRNAFDGVFKELFTDLGSLIANSISIRERQQFGRAERFLELEFELSDSQYVPQKLATETDTPIRFETVTETTDDAVRILVTVLDDVSDGVREKARQITDVHSAEWFGDPSNGQLTLDIQKPFLATMATKHGGHLAYSVSNTETTRVQIRLPTNVATRPLIESLTNAFEQIDLIARRERSERTLPDDTTLQQLLTDRQYEILRTAYFGGYFTSPRQITGNDLAENFGISNPVIHDHLRAAQRLLFDYIFDSDTDTGGLVY